MTEEKLTADKNLIDDSSRVDRSAMIDTPSRRRLLHFIGAGGVAGLAGCTNLGQSDDSEDGPQTSVTIAIPSSVTRDGAGTHGVIPYWTRIIEPLTWPDHEMNVQPWLAEDWELIDERTWRFHLRDNVTFHNGEPLNADVVLFSLRKMLTEQPWTQGWMRVKPEALRKVDEMTVEITNNPPMPRFPGAVAHIWHGIQHPDSSPGWGGTIGSGPYKLEELEQDQYATVSAFEDYWQGPPNIDEITFRTIQDFGTRDLALEGGEVDIAFDLSPSKYEELQESEDRTATTHPLTVAAQFYLNNTEPPMDDVTFRKALNYAISQEEIIDGSLNGVSAPARGTIPEILWWSAHDSLPEYGPDKDEARGLLDESNYDGETITIVSSSSPHRVSGPTNPQTTAQIAQEAFADIGVDAEIRMMEQAAYSEAENTGEGGHLFQGASYTIAARPGDFANNLVAEGDGDTPGPHEFEEEVQEKVRSLLNQAISAPDREKTKAAFSELEQIIVAQEAIVIPLYYKHYVVGSQSHIRGGDYHPTMRHSRFEDLEIEE